MTRQLERPREAPHGNRPCMEKLLNRCFKIPFGPRNTAKKIQTKRIMLGKGMAGDVGFRKKAEARDAAGPGKLMPLRLADRAKLHAANHAMEERFHGAEVAQGFG